MTREKSCFSKEGIESTDTEILKVKRKASFRRSNVLSNKFCWAFFVHQKPGKNFVNGHLSGYPVPIFGEVISSWCPQKNNLLCCEADLIKTFFNLKIVSAQWKGEIVKYQYNERENFSGCCLFAPRLCNTAWYMQYSSMVIETGCAGAFSCGGRCNNECGFDFAWPLCLVWYRRLLL